MATKKKQQSKLAKILSKFDPTTKKGAALLFVVLFAVIGGGYMLYNSYAATITYNAYGRLYDSRTGLGISGAKVAICYQGQTLTTDSSGYFRFTIPTGAYYCSRVTSGVSSSWAGPVLNNRPEHASAKTYENQVAGKNCYHVSTCPTVTQTWDRGSDTGVYFAYLSPLPKVTSFIASPMTITSGSSATLAWKSTDSFNCAIGGGGLGVIVPSNGTFQVKPTTSTTYQIACNGNGGTSPIANVTVGVYHNPPWDINGDGIVNKFDRAIIEANMNKSGGYQQGDLNDDGIINLYDMSLFLAHCSVDCG